MEVALKKNSMKKKNTQNETHQVYFNHQLHDTQYIKLYSNIILDIIL